MYETMAVWEADPTLAAQFGNGVVYLRYRTQS
jgi:hypothetical protein